MISAIAQGVKRAGRQADFFLQQSMKQRLGINAVRQRYLENKAALWQRGAGANRKMLRN